MTLAPLMELRTPHWLSEQARRDLAENAERVLTGTTPLPSVRESLDSLLTELGVAQARHLMWPEKVALARTALGYPADFLPIRMSEAERVAALSLTHLSPSTRTELGGPVETT